MPACRNGPVSSNVRPQTLTLRGMPASKKTHPAAALTVADHPELVNHGRMWDDFLNDSDLPSLAPATCKVFLRFLNRANRNSLHPKDLRYFYEFVRYAHAHRARITSAELALILQNSGFPQSKAVLLASCYENGRAVLASTCPVLRNGVIYS